MLYVNPVLANPALRGSAAQDSALRQKNALKEFEQIFLYQFLREMRKTGPKEGIFKSSQQQDFFEEMMDDCLAGQMAQSGQFGIARQIGAQWEPVQTANTAEKTGLLPLRRAVEGYTLSRENTGIACIKTKEYAVR